MRIVFVVVVAACGGSNNSAGPDAQYFDSATVAHKRVFVTSTTYSGDLATASGTDFSTQDAGPTGANKLCQNAATAGLLAGTYKAIIVQPNGGLDALADTGPWYRVDNMLAINNRAQLKTTPSVPIEIDELGHSQAGASSTCVWTGMFAGGAQNPGCALSNFGIWTFANSAQLGTYGTLSAADASWIYQGTKNCNGPCHLYCIEQ